MNVRTGIAVMCCVAMSAMIVGCGGNVEKTEASLSTIVRNADPCEHWRGWQEGGFPTRVPQLRDGNASHLTPSEIIHYSAIDNSIFFTDAPVNPLLIITYMHFTGALFGTPNAGDFETTLFYATGYYPMAESYRGFYPQVTGLAFQISRDQWYDRARTIEAFHEVHFGRTIPFESFKTVYAVYAEIMNGVAGTAYAHFPQFGAFTKLDADDIHAFFVKIGSSLAGNLFTMVPVHAELYENPGIYCAVK